ncbi:ZYRO0D05038p [Zygosaccharomyces rouxii]|uniref:ZYRO0D05038p n=1 Tax=Zygosaccharomyces rouxii (strain ATCC 2623 / CBS 732 / NBRC 1130 / NCYC 568 / NRRL Y-229) TaxID=559307 RepID=C5DVA0_ZYGRC|nr:uncharacterized protein ZYRO0D05038g [Zygosaccharomyces rouxii]KAH9200632.1 hypothetical protein LQ764DRAFT_97256 [Zygosaccharomyces rouxii]CAR27719.1 ZYRO0D05038p [Zygosaccharomyces rouxii]
MAFPEVEQLQQARRLAMENNPNELLPKVLETSGSLYLSQGTSYALKLELSRFFSQLLLQILSDCDFPTSEKPFVAQQQLRCLWSIIRSIRDGTAYKYSVLSLSAAYPLLFDLVAKTSNKETWELMQQMKSFIVQRWNTPFPETPIANENDMFADDAKSMGVRLATAKFIAEIVIVHTSRSSSSPNDVISISSVPEGHPVISNKQQIESEAKKFLDVLLNYLVEEPIMVAPLFSGILNCLAFVMRHRPQATMRILGALLNFNVDAKFQQEGTSILNYRLSKRFVERSYKNFVQFGLKSQLIKNHGSMAPLHARLSKISKTLHVIGEETRSKGVLNFDESQFDNKMTPKDKQKYTSLRKRQQRQLQSQPQPPTQQQLPQQIQPQRGSASNSPAPNSTPQLVQEALQQQPEQVPNDIQLLSHLQKYTMSKNTPNFFNGSPIAIDNSYCAIYSLMNSNNSGQDVSKLSQEVMVKLCSEAFYNTDTTKLISGLSIVASRYTDLINKSTQSRTGVEQSSDASGSRKRKSEQDSPPSKRLKNEEPHDQDDEDREDAIPLELTQSASLTEDEKMRHVQGIVQRIVAIKDSDENPGVAGMLGHDTDPLMKIKLLQWNQNSWLHLLTRLATRGLTHNPAMCDLIREWLQEQFLQDISNRIGMVLEWLSEEWYAETLVGATSYETYNKWSLSVLNSLVPFLENQHRRLFIRLMSELPRITQAHIDTVRPICLDPARASLGFQTLKFLVMFRPPVKPKVHSLLLQLKSEDPTTSQNVDSIISKFYT